VRSAKPPPLRPAATVSNADVNPKDNTVDKSRRTLFAFVPAAGGMFLAVKAALVKKA
jgi:hypothetical protein